MISRFFNFILTQKCNWNCSYCNYPNIKNPTTINEEMIDKLDWLFDIVNSHSESISVLQGGEIGLVPSKAVEKVMNRLTTKCIINTNGLFMSEENMTNLNITNKIQEIWWHVTDEPEKNSQIIDIYRPDNIPIIAGIVGVDAEKIIEFIKSHSDIKIGYVNLETPLIMKDMVNEYKKLELFILKNRSRFTSNAIENFYFKKNNYKYLKIQRMICQQLCYSACFDISNMTISPCAVRCNTVTIELNEKNAEDLINNCLSFPNWETSHCDSCIRQCIVINSSKDIIKYLKVISDAKAS